MEAKDNAWSISIKSVGAEQQGDFTIEVSPEDDLQALYSGIEHVTGLKAEQQRLIYRGRLIHDHDTKIKDIVGLESGHTIHLVRKRETTAPAPEAAEAAPPADDASDDLFGTASASSAMPLLAALLGLGSSDDEERPTETGRRWRRYSRRRVNHRLTAEDFEPMDPGSMESVRQGMMTLHTILPHAQAVVDEQVRVPTDFRRRFYVGQWIDCLDTVNLWLEATIVEIVEPDDILPPRSTSAAAARSPRSSSSSPPPYSDPAVAANDLEGRRQLLLEPCPEGDSGDEGGELVGFRRRDYNEGVQLLLVHYNGWPHRWDEWIRSDSDRIRPFRVRTRHPNSSAQVSPTPQSVFHESPPTFIRTENETADRQAMLPELLRVMTAVENLLSRTIADAPPSSTPAARSATEAAQLPWSQEQQQQGESDKLSDGAPENRRANYQRELEVLAPLLDRLGRTLTDAAPHVAALARSLPEHETPELESIEEHPTSLGGLLSLLGRDRRRASNASSNVVVAGESATASVGGSVQTGVASEESIDPDLTDFATGIVNTTRGEVRRGPRSRNSASDDAAGILGAYLAAASLGGMVAGEGEDADNNMQGLGRILRERGTGTGGIDIHIHAVVTAPAMGGGLGLATLGAGGGGNTGGLGSTLTSTNEATSSFFSGGRSGRGSSNRHSSRSPQVSQDEDDGIFSELYSENPDPVDPSRASFDGENSPGSSRSTRQESLRGNTPPRTNSFSAARARTRRARRSDASRSGTNQSGHSRGNLFGRFFRRNTPSDEAS